jgi:hypothetical protein
MVTVSGRDSRMGISNTGSGHDAAICYAIIDLNRAYAQSAANARHAHPADARALS